MKKLTDQELDSVFKNAAEGYEPAFDPAAWDAMHAKLDQPKPAFWKRWIPFAFLGLFIFSAGVWVGTHLSDHELTPSNQAPFESKAKSIQQEQWGKAKSTEQSKIQNQSDSRQIPVSKGSHITNDLKSESETVIAKLNSEDHGQSSNVMQRADNRNPINETTFLWQDEKSSVLQEITSIDSVTDLMQGEVEEVKKDTAKEETVEEEKNKKEIDSRAFYVRLLASPDFSSIDYASATTAGSNYALLVDYQVTNRWSISTGGIWSMKKYSSNKETTYGKYTADRMVGDCRVLDIPVNVYYRFLPKAKISFYAGAGLSSYIMMEEDYTYTFDFPSGSRDFSYYIEKENNEWFKVLNVSLGVQYRVAQRLHVLVEPFLKAPLSGVGEWDVKLSSMGIFMGLKYKIN